MKILEPEICFRDDPEYIYCKEELEKLCQQKVNEKTTGEKDINTELFKIYKTLFEPKINVSNALIQDYFNRIETRSWLKSNCKDVTERVNT